MKRKVPVCNIIIAAVTYVLAANAEKKEEAMLFQSYKSSSDVLNLFPSTVGSIDVITESALNSAYNQIDAIISIDSFARTYENTMQRFDELNAISDLAIIYPILEALEMVSPDKHIRDTAHAALLKIQHFMVDQINNNIQLYRAIKEYVLGNASQESLSEEQNYFIRKVMDDFKRTGLDLPVEQIEEVKKIKKALAALELQFGTNIAQDNQLIGNQKLPFSEKSIVQSLNSINQ